MVRSVHGREECRVVLIVIATVLAGCMRGMGMLRARYILRIQLKNIGDVSNIQLMPYSNQQGAGKHVPTNRRWLPGLILWRAHSHPFWDVYFAGTKSLETSNGKQVNI